MPSGLARITNKLSTQLYAAIFVTVLITIITVIVSWQSFERVGETQQRVNNVSLPEMVSAFGLARTNSALVAAAPRLTTVPNEIELANVSAEIDTYRKEFENTLNDLLKIEDSRDFEDALTQSAEDLTHNIEEIESLRKEYFLLRDKSERFNISVNRLEQTIRTDLLPLIDSQFFYVMTGYESLDKGVDELEIHRSEKEINLFRHLSDLEKEVNIAIQLLASTATVNDAALVDVLRDQFESSYDGIQRSLMEIDRVSVLADTLPLFEALNLYGMGEGNGFDLRIEEINIQSRQVELLQQNRIISTELVNQVEEIVSNSNMQANEAIGEANATVSAANRLLLILVFASVILAFLIAWLFVGKHILNRLEELSVRMRTMAKGDLEQEVLVRGKDEIAEMAKALEVFRKNSLEVQRLNLVEELAEEVVSKNQELEKVLDELKQAQNQIVMREKLAALGELTAGVAHEIKNPLNFVKNFSESSLELLEEMEDATEIEDKDELIEEIKDLAAILKENLQRIHGHGTRADRIVHDMLSMGRGEAQAQKVPINPLVDEHAKLAYHSSRATTEGFRLHTTTEFDPTVGDAIVVPQDLGRVVLNIVTNACYATHEKRIKLEENEGKTDYEPELRIKTKREGSTIEIAIRDNGNGIPDDIKEKIFNPFFTTKPTDEGTGLGLAMSNDIIREHGGSLTVTSEQGKFTEFTINIPEDASGFFLETDDESTELDQDSDTPSS